MIAKAGEPGSRNSLYDIATKFGRQEPGGAAEIRGFWHLKAARPGALGTEGIKWNFTKFLVGRGGAVIRRYGPAEPARLEPDVFALLDRRGGGSHGDHR
jgi:glutathione peroxidase